MSRKKAKELFSWDAVQDFLRERNVTLLSAGLEEVPMAYKDIDAVMAPSATFRTPRTCVRVRWWYLPTADPRRACAVQGQK